MGLIIFNGVSSLDMNAQVETPPEYHIPEREYETIHVTGRNGDIIIDSGTYQNTERSYTLAFDAKSDGYSELMSAVSTWLHSADGYAKLEDSYEPSHYRMAKYKGGDDISNIYHKAGELTVKFECMPQRFLKSGTASKTVSNNGTITNPTSQIALPKITLTGASGTLTITSTHNGASVTQKVTVSATGTSNIVIDSAEQDCYSGSTNLNSKVTLNNLEFPVLYPGSNKISFSTFTACAIVPNWWEL